MAAPATSIRVWRTAATKAASVLEAAHVVNRHPMAWLYDVSGNLLHTVSVPAASNWDREARAKVLTGLVEAESLACH